MTFSLNGIQILMVTSTTFALVGMYLYYRKKKYSIPTKWEEIGTVSKLIIYPLKSGKRIVLHEAECTTFGLRDTNGMFQLRDRSLIIFTSKDHEFRTARTYPNLMLISVTVKDKDHLLLNAPNMSTLCFKMPFNSSLVQEEGVKQTKFSYHGGEILTTYDCGDEVAKWLSQYLLNKESGLRLGYNDGRYTRDITKAHKQLLNYYKHLSNSSTGMYSDLSSVLLVNQKSVDDLNAKLKHPSDGPEITSNNFRPNIVVDGPDLKPYLEDDWDWIKIGDVVFRNVKECVRCTMTTIDPETGNRSKVGEPLKTLNQYRVTKGPEKGPIMGIYLEVKKIGGSISVGEKVLITRK